jgi:hypothetical protein
MGPHAVAGSAGPAAVIHAAFGRFASLTLSTFLDLLATSDQSAVATRIRRLPRTY